MVEPPNLHLHGFDNDLTADVIASLQNAQRYENQDFTDSDTDSEFENEIYISDAQQQWEENIKQIEMAVFFVLCPVIGKLVGRKTAQSLWTRFVTWRWQSAQKSGSI